MFVVEWVILKNKTYWRDDLRFDTLPEAKRFFDKMSARPDIVRLKVKSSEHNVFYVFKK